jgi:hypothetical protein
MHPPIPLPVAVVDAPNPLLLFACFAQVLASADSGTVADFCTCDLAVVLTTTASPTASPTASATEAATEEVTEGSVASTDSPTASPTASATEAPTEAQTEAPTEAQTEAQEEEEEEEEAIEMIQLEATMSVDIDTVPEADSAEMNVLVTGLKIALENTIGTPGAVVTILSVGDVQLEEEAAERRLASADVNFRVEIPATDGGEDGEYAETEAMTEAMEAVQEALVEATAEGGGFAETLNDAVEQAKVELVAAGVITEEEAAADAMDMNVQVQEVVVAGADGVGDDDGDAFHLIIDAAGAAAGIAVNWALVAGGSLIALGMGQ